MLSQELVEKLSKGELSKEDYPCLNDPSATFHGTSPSASVLQPPAAHSMRSRRTPTWARPRASDDGYSRCSSDIAFSSNNLSINDVSYECVHIYVITLTLILILLSSFYTVILYYDMHLVTSRIWADEFLCLSLVELLDQRYEKILLLSWELIFLMIWFSKNVTFQLRVCHKLTSKLKREVVLGSSSLDDPPQFITVTKFAFLFLLLVPSLLIL